MSLMPLVLCVPARRLASCQLTMRARMSGRTAMPKMSSDSSISPTSWLSRFFIVSFILLGPCLSRRRLAGRLGRRRRIGLTPDRRWERQILRLLALHRVLDEDVTAVASRHGAAHHDEATFDIGGDDAQILRGHPDIAHMAGHLLALEGLARVLTLAGRTEAAMRDRDTVRASQTPGMLAIHAACAT